MNYLDFEQPIAELHEQLEKAKQIGEKGEVDVTGTIKELEAKIRKTQKKIYGNQCTECKSLNYRTQVNVQGGVPKLELKRHCIRERKHTVHKIKRR